VTVLKKKDVMNPVQKEKIRHAQTGMGVLEPNIVLEESGEAVKVVGQEKLALTANAKKEVGVVGMEFLTLTKNAT
jgi:hypothetical protein